MQQQAGGQTSHGYPRRVFKRARLNSAGGATVALRYAKRRCRTHVPYSELAKSPVRFRHCMGRNEYSVYLVESRVVVDATQVLTQVCIRCAGKGHPHNSEIDTISEYTPPDST